MGPARPLPAPLRAAEQRVDRRCGIVTCTYHGLGFDGAGACVANPHGPITKALCARSFPIVEAHRAVWIWMGDPALADPAQLRDLRFLNEVPETAFNKGYLCGSGHYQLFVDNILDLSHTDFCTRRRWAADRSRGRAPRSKARDDGIISIHWHSFDEVPLPLVAARLPAGVTRVDAWTEVEWSPPGIIKLVNGAVAVGSAREAGSSVVNVHILTPETASTSHYFFASTRDYAVDDAAMNEMIRQVRAQIFASEDEPMIAAQQERIGDGDFWSLRPALLKIDEGAVRVRRRMDALIAAERELSA